MKRAIILGITGLISGVFTFYIMNGESVGIKSMLIYTNATYSGINLMFFVFPGLVFGVLLSIVDYLYTFKDVVAHFFSILFSAFAYFAAITVAVGIALVGVPESLLFYITGFIGSLILSFFLKMKYHISWRSFIFIVLVGTLSSYIGQDIDNPYYIFLVWQPAVAAAIGFALSDAEKSH